MSSICDNLRKWFLENLDVIVSAERGPFKGLPELHHLNHVTKGRNLKIWEYVIKHVRARSVAERVKRTLLKRRVMMELREMTDGCCIDVDLEVIRQKVNNAEGRRKYLEQCIVDIQGRILNLDYDVEKIYNNIVKIKEMHTLLSMLALQNKEKYLQNETCHSYLISVINEFKRYRKVPNLQKQLLPSKESVSKQSFSNITELLNHLVFLFKTSLTDNSSISLQAIKIIRSEIYRLLGVGNSINVLCLFQKDLRKDVENFNNQQSKELLTCTINHSDEIENVQQLIQNLKFIHVQETFDAKVICGETEKLLINKDSIMLNAEIHGGLMCLVPSDSVKIELFQKLSEIQGVTKGIQSLETILSQQETTRLFIETDSKNKECHDIQDIMTSTYKMFDSIHWLLLDIPKSTNIISNKLQTSCVISKEKFAVMPMLNSYIEELNEMFVEDRNFFWIYSRKVDLFKSIIQNICIHDSISNAQFCKALRIHPSTSVDAFVEQCICVHNSIASQTSSSDFSISESEASALIESKIISEDYFSHLFDCIEQRKLCIKNGKECVSRCEIMFPEVKGLIGDFWNQDAQYIFPLEAEGKSLRTWLTIANLIESSQPQTES